MTEQDIQLRLNPTTRREELVGISDELIPDSRIIDAVASHRRIFPYVVQHLAINQYRKENPDYIPSNDTPPCRELLDIMRVVRDELLLGIESVKGPTNAQLQAENMTRSVRPVRPPYFVR